MSKKLNDATPEEWDVVTKPQHYNNGGIEAIEYIQQQLGEGFIDYCEGNTLKYLHRWRYKDFPIQDLRKAHWYLDKMIETVEKIDV